MDVSYTRKPVVSEEDVQRALRILKSTPCMDPLMSPEMAKFKHPAIAFRPYVDSGACFSMDYWKQTDKQLSLEHDKGNRARSANELGDPEAVSFDMTPPVLAPADTSSADNSSGSHVSESTSNSEETHGLIDKEDRLDSVNYQPLHEEDDNDDDTTDFTVDVPLEVELTAKPKQLDIAAVTTNDGGNEVGQSCDPESTERDEPPSEEGRDTEGMYCAPPVFKPPAVITLNLTSPKCNRVAELKELEASVKSADHLVTDASEIHQIGAPPAASRRVPRKLSYKRRALADKPGALLMARNRMAVDGRKAVQTATENGASRACTKLTQRTDGMKTSNKHLLDVEGEEGEGEEDEEVGDSEGDYDNSQGNKSSLGLARTLRTRSVRALAALRGLFTRRFGRLLVSAQRLP